METDIALSQLQVMATVAFSATVPTMPLLLALCHPSPTNPRKNFPQPEQEDLQESIKQLGVLQPILVRRWQDTLPWEGAAGDKPLYEIVAGERRWRASCSAGLSVIPGLVRELSDIDVLKIQLIENLQRLDLHPLEEAEGYERLMQQGYTADQVAEEIDKSRAYIYGRLKLLALSDDARRLFYGGMLNPSTALLLARIPTANLQKKALEDITRTDHNREIMSVRAASRHIQDRYMLKLASAPFPRGDNDLIPTAKRCHECPKRTGNQPELYKDVESADVCTDPDCFSAKKQAHAEKTITEAKATGTAVITGDSAKKIAPYGCRETYHDIKGFVQLDKRCYADTKQRTYREILGDAPDGLTLVEDVREGVFVPVVAEPALAAALKAAGIKPPETSNTKSEQEKREQAAAKLENTYRANLLAKIRAEVANTMSRLEETLEETELRLVAARFYQRTDFEDRKRIAKLWNTIDEKDVHTLVYSFGESIETMAAGDLACLLLDLAIIGEVQTDAYSLKHRPNPEAMLKLADSYGLDPAEIRSETEKTATEKQNPPSKAAQAQKQPRAKKAAQAAESTAPTTSEKNPEEKIIERNEKPSALPTQAEYSVYQIGATVRVKDDARGPNGQRRKCCGREGVIEDIAHPLLISGHLVVRFSEKKTDVVCNLAWNEVTVLSPATANAIETDEKPTAAETINRCTNTIELPLEA